MGELLGFGRGLMVSFRRRQGELGRGGPEGVPRRVVRASGVNVEPERLGRYLDVCGLDGSAETLPPIFPYVLFLKPLTELVTERGFPLSPLGLIHIRQVIEQSEPIPVGARLDLETGVDDARITERGVEVDFSMSVAREGRCPWQGMMTVLSRSLAAQRGRPRKHPAAPRPSREPRVLVRVPEETGRRYAAASGDWSPHHIHRLTSRVVGFKRPIAHGMWTLARTVGLLPQREAPLRIEASFKRPVVMPGEVGVDFEERDDGGLEFEVWDPQEGAPHLRGSLGSLAG